MQPGGYGGGGLLPFLNGVVSLGMAQEQQCSHRDRREHHEAGDDKCLSFHRASTIRPRPSSHRLQESRRKFACPMIHTAVRTRASAAQSATAGLASATLG